MRSQSSVWRFGKTHARLLGSALALAAAGVLFVWANQLAALALLPLLAALLGAIERRDRRAQELALRITDAHEKIEVPSGAWGELARAVNDLLHERRVQQRLRDALPTPLPLEALHSLLGGDLLTAGQARQVAVLLVSAPVRGPAWEQGVRPAAAAAWHELASAAAGAAQRYGALLQPCGDAVMLVFGAFDDQAAQAVLRDALAAAGELEQGWRHQRAALAPLSLALASGYALATALPGLGLCVVGAPVEQAVGLQQLALRARRFGLMCNEDAYHALRREQGAAWQATDLRITLANRPPQVVYRLGEPR